MKKLLCLLAITAMVIGTAGCTAKLTDSDLLEQTFSNMQEVESYKAKGKISIKVMGMTMDPFDYEILFEKPDRSYLKMDADILGTGEKLTVEYLIEGENIKLRSDFLDELEPGFREMMEESLVVEMENPQDYEDMFMDLADMVNFEIIANPAGLDPKQYKSYKFVLDSQKLKEQIAEEMELTDEYLPEDFEELSEEEQAAYLQMIGEILDELDVEMEAVMVVDTKTKHFHSLQLDMAMNVPIPFGELGELQKVNMSYKIEIEYLEINTELNFPSFD